MIMMMLMMLLLFKLFKLLFFWEFLLLFMAIVLSYRILTWFLRISLGDCFHRCTVSAATSCWRIWSVVHTSNDVWMIILLKIPTKTHIKKREKNRPLTHGISITHSLSLLSRLETLFSPNNQSLFPLSKRPLSRNGLSLFYFAPFQLSPGLATASPCAR